MQQHLVHQQQQQQQIQHHQQQGQHQADHFLRNKLNLSDLQTKTISIFQINSNNMNEINIRIEYYKCEK